MSSKATNTSKENKQGTESSTEAKPQTCGVIMPISAIDGLSAEHWIDVQAILYDAIREAGFTPNIVSTSEDVGIIHQRIVHNLYYNPIVVCDVSAKNPNVMFELGLRLAFDKPTIIVKDDATSYNFDTSPIEHLDYPRDLRFNSIIKFKEDLKNKIIATYNKSQKIEGFSTFLKHFGDYKISNLGTKEVTSDQYILKSIERLIEEVSSLKKAKSIDVSYNHYLPKDLNMLSIHNLVKSRISEFVKAYNLSGSFEIYQKQLTDTLLEFIYDSIGGSTNISSKLKTQINSIVDNELLPF